MLQARVVGAALCGAVRVGCGGDDDGSAASGDGAGSTKVDMLLSAFAKAYYDDTIRLLQPVEESLTLGQLDPAGRQTTADVLLETGTIENAVDVDTLIGAPEVKAVQEKLLDFDAAAVEAEAKEASSGS